MAIDCNRCLSIRCGVKSGHELEWLRLTAFLMLILLEKKYGMEVLSWFHVSLFLLNNHSKRRMFADYICTDIFFSVLNFLSGNQIIAYVMLDKIIHCCEFRREFMIS